MSLLQILGFWLIASKYLTSKSNNNNNVWVKGLGEASIVLVVVGWFLVLGSSAGLAKQVFEKFSFLGLDSYSSSALAADMLCLLFTCLFYLLVTRIIKTIWQSFWRKFARFVALIVLFIIPVAYTLMGGVVVQAMYSEYSEILYKLPYASLSPQWPSPDLIWDIWGRGLFMSYFASVMTAALLLLPIVVANIIYRIVGHLGGNERATQMLDLARRVKADSTKQASDLARRVKMNISQALDSASGQLAQAGRFLANCGWWRLAPADTTGIEDLI